MDRHPPKLQNQEITLEKVEAAKSKEEDYQKQV